MYGLGLTSWVILDPQLISLKLRTATSIVLINYVSWNTNTISFSDDAGGIVGVTQFYDTCALWAYEEMSSGKCHDIFCASYRCAKYMGRLS